MNRFARTFDPWHELDQLRGEVNRLFTDWNRPALRRQAAFPAINVWNDEQSLMVTAEVPGVSGDDLDVTVAGNTLTIRGKRSQREPVEVENYVRRERWSDTFSRTVELPVEVDAQHTEATYEKGILTLKLQRPEEQRPKKITVKAK